MPGAPSSGVRRLRLSKQQARFNKRRRKKPLKKRKGR